MEAWLETIQPIRIPRPKLVVAGGSAAAGLPSSVSRMNGAADGKALAAAIKASSGASSATAMSSSSASDSGKRSPL